MLRLGEPQAFPVKPQGLQTLRAVKRRLAEAVVQQRMRPFHKEAILHARIGHQRSPPGHANHPLRNVIQYRFGAGAHKIPDLRILRHDVGLFAGMDIAVM